MTGNQVAVEIAKQSKSSLDALNKKASEIPLSTSSIGARDVEMDQQPLPGPIPDSGTVE
jgi:hypothetical protein